MSDRTHVWIHQDVLARAAGQDVGMLQKQRSSLDLSRSGNFAWSFCWVVNNDISAMGGNGTMHIQVTDEFSEYDGKRMELSAQAIAEDKNGQARVVLANAWESSDQGQDVIPPDDLTSLTHLHEPSVVKALRARYDHDKIYTSTGPILIALNPFKEIPGLYTDDAMSDYWAAGEGVSKLTLDLGPHTYQMAHGAFRNMMDGLGMENTSGNRRASVSSTIKINQSMLVSGESGAGKTVTTKHVMKYLATLSQRKAEHAKRRREASPGRSEAEAPRRMSSMRRLSRNMSWKAGAVIEEKILESNPIMEAFGNARTVRNDNSSRFGKFIELQFKNTGSLMGASIETYLLEKVRLISQGPGERNFHIFYELLSAATDDERETLCLQNYNIRDFKMTSSGTYDRRDGVHDDELYDELVVAMGTMGFDFELQEDIFKVTAAFLHAGNLNFIEKGGDSSEPDPSNPHLQHVLELLGVEQSAFRSALCEFEIEAGRSSYMRQLNPEQAQKGLEAFIKGTYGAMFSFLVQTINKKIDSKSNKKLQKAASISVLDIFGFESFQLNSFEQLCINFCNEALQQQFNLFIFKSEQEEYKREGIEWNFISFPDNQDVIDLIEKKTTGLIPLLTDVCRTPKASDKNFLENAYKICEKNTRFGGSPLHKGKGEFIVHHYAGPVLYQTDGFVEKNKDEFPRGASALLESSSVEFVQLLGKINSENVVETKKKKQRPTVGGQFASQLLDLRNRIEKTHPHYIRCLKPNQSLLPHEFENAIIADQLRYAGVLEAIRVSRVGYSQRYAHAEFVERYRFLGTMTTKTSGNLRTKLNALSTQVAKKICRVLKEQENDGVPFRMPNENAENKIWWSAAGLQVGQTKVFLRPFAFDYLERARTQRLSTAAILMQSAARRFLARCRYIRIKKHIILGQACIRRYLAFRFMIDLRRKRCAIRIQKTQRMAAEKKKYVQKLFVILWLQKHERGRKGRVRAEQRSREVSLERSRMESAVKIQCMMRVRLARAELAIRRRQYEMRQKSIHASDEVRQLRAERTKIALAADKAAAVAKQETREKTKALENLKGHEQDAQDATKRAKEAQDELGTVKAELAQVKAELQACVLIAEEAAKRVTELETENMELKKKMNDGEYFFDHNNPAYADHADLQQLDMRLSHFAAKSKASKKETDALVQALAILR